jgi:hypothetical protein
LYPTSLRALRHPQPWDALKTSARFEVPRSPHKS